MKIEGRLSHLDKHPLSDGTSAYEMSIRLKNGSTYGARFFGDVNCDYNCDKWKNQDLINEGDLCVFIEKRWPKNITQKLIIDGGKSKSKVSKEYYEKCYDELQQILMPKMIAQIMNAPGSFGFID